LTIPQGGQDQVSRFASAIHDRRQLYVEELTTFGQLTDAARAATSFAMHSVQSSGEGLLGTIHLLAGILQNDDQSGAIILRQMGVDPGADGDLRKLLSSSSCKQEHLPDNSDKEREAVLFTEEASGAIQAAFREAVSMGHGYIGTEHLLLGLVSEERGSAGHLLRSQGASVPLVREGVWEFLAQ